MSEDSEPCCRRLSYRSAESSFDVVRGSAWPVGTVSASHLQNVYCLSKTLVVNAAVDAGGLDLSQNAGRAAELWNFMSGSPGQSEPPIYEWFATERTSRGALLDRGSDNDGDSYLSEVRLSCWLDQIYLQSGSPELPGIDGVAALHREDLIAPRGGPNEVVMASEVAFPRLLECTPGFGLFSNPKSLADYWWNCIQGVDDVDDPKSELLRLLHANKLPKFGFLDNVHSRWVETNGPFLTEAALPAIPFMNDYVGYTTAVGVGFLAISRDLSAVAVGLSNQVTISRDEFFEMCDDLVELGSDGLP